MSKGELLIGIFVDEGDRYEYARKSYEIKDIGVVPAVGDIIVEPGVMQGLNREEPTNRLVYEVQSRYFLPAEADGSPPKICLVVKERKGRDKEINVLGD
ncbi:hypothetical protein [Azospirillum himalayense]|uniref:Uncharacterized protein n=1 Tax=Azospirillum himalayense TaxID=654847 RepID=A0ABW0GAP3_9PROT